MSNEKRTYLQRARADKWRETRDRIVEATVALHREVGPVRTTASEIARRAGVSRLTVRNHFPDDRSLFDACQSHVLAADPPPDLSAAIALEPPAAALEATLAALYADYAARAEMTANVMRDRRAIPALDELLAETRDRATAELVQALVDRLGECGRDRRAALRLAVDFFTWETLAGAGLDNEAAAVAMTRMVLST